MQGSDTRLRVPAPQGLYHPHHEHDACGMGLVASIRGEKSHDIICKGLEVLLNLTHRGAAGCDPETGDGAGILIQIPHVFFARECGELGMQLPEEGAYGVAMCFLPVDKHSRLQCEGVFERISTEEGLKVIGWRDTPLNVDAIGREARATQPYIEQFFAGRPEGLDEEKFERLLYKVRRRIENEIAESDIEGKDEFFYIPSFSCRTIIYKGLMLAPQIEKFYFELANPLVTSALALVHQRFSTNTFPSWKLAHPYRYIAHNGEINTVRGNVSWMNARQSVFESPLYGEDIDKLFPVIVPGGSDSASLDNAVEFLYQSGRSIDHVMAMMIPEAWAGNPDMDEDKRAFYEYHASLMEPWDGPAAIAFTDGRIIGATLDRNGLRPRRSPAGRTQKGPLAARPHVPGGYGAEAHHCRCGNQEAVGLAEAVCGVAPAAAGNAGTVAGTVARDCIQSRNTSPPAARVWVQRRGSSHPSRAHGRYGPGASRVDGNGYAAGVPIGPSAASVQLLPTIVCAGHESAD